MLLKNEKQTWESLASEPLLVKKTFPIFFAVKISSSSFARSCTQSDNYPSILKRIHITFSKESKATGKSVTAANKEITG